jgi:hypothetical protein
VLLWHRRCWSRYRHHRVNRQTSGDVRATVHSFLAEAEYVGEIVCGLAIAVVARLGGVCPGARDLGCAVRDHDLSNPAPRHFTNRKSQIRDMVALRALVDGQVELLARGPSRGGSSARSRLGNTRGYD